VGPGMPACNGRGAGQLQSKQLYVSRDPQYAAWVMCGWSLCAASLLLTRFFSPVAAGSGIPVCIVFVLRGVSMVGGGGKGKHVHCLMRTQPLSFVSLYMYSGSSLLQL
jgi:hypothetical protein